MSRETIEAMISRVMCSNIKLLKRGINDYIVDVPFYFDDGDALKIILKSNADGTWNLSDEGHTLMYLSYNNFKISTNSQRRKLFDKILLTHLIKDNDCCLTMERINSDEVANAVFSFVQGLIRVSDLTYWKKETVKSAFWDNFKSMLSGAAGGRTTEFDFTYPNMSNYPVDCRLITKRSPIHIYAAGNENKTNEATISIYYFEKNQVLFPNWVVFHSDGNITRKASDKIADVADKTFSSLEASAELLPKFVEKYEGAA